MALNDDQRAEYLRRARVTQQQIDETVGELPVHQGSIQERGISAADADVTRSGLRRVLADTAIIAAKYNALAQDGELDQVDPAEVEADRGHLEELFADEYTLMNPFGEEHDKARIIDGMVHGTISYDGMGQAGFEALGQTLQIHGDTAVAKGDYRMSASGRAKHAESGETFQQDVSGTYRITNTYVFRDNRWQAAATQMTHLPPEPGFTLTSEA